jgi:hypothetical protein
VRWEASTRSQSARALEHRSSGEVAGAGDEDVEAAEVLHNACDRPLDRDFVRNLEREDRSQITELCGGGSVFVHVAARDRDGRARLA